MKTFCKLLFFSHAVLFAEPRFFVEGGPLFWWPHESGLDYAIVDHSTKDICFDFGVGGKLGASVLIPSRDFSIFLLWTHFDGGGSGSSSGQTVTPIWSTTNVVGANRASANWSVAFNALDGGLKANFFPRGYLEISPSIGLKTAWIDQAFKISILNNRVKMMSDMWGIGPRFAIDTLWKFNAMWGLYVDVAGSLLWTCFDIKQKETQGAATFVNLKEDKQTLKAVLELTLGPYFQYQFADALLRLSLGYDAQSYFNQNQFRYLPSRSIDDGNLFFQGLVLKALVGF